MTPREDAPPAPPERVYGIIGHPLGHTLSPLLHNWGFRRMGVRAAYVAFPTPPARLAAVIQAVRALPVAGLSVTIPHKEAVMPLLDEVDPLARRAGAVNTLVWQGGALVGHNTDVAGFVAPLAGLPSPPESALVLGAGGATRGVILPLLAAKPGWLIIANRTADKAATLANLFADQRGQTQLQGCGLDALANHVDKAGPFDLVINATSASLSGEAIALPTGTVTNNGFAYDMMYGKALTPFLEAQKAAGVHQLADGLGMLVEQAALAFALWRDVMPETEPVYKALRERLARH